jgi:hypothetical protein
MLNENLELLLSNIEKFEEYLEKRAYELLECNTDKTYMRRYPKHSSNIEYDIDKVWVSFEEDRQYPDTESILLELDQLKMNEEEWKEHLQEKIIEKQKKQEAEEKEKKEISLKEKIKQKENLEKEIKQLQSLSNLI